MDIKKIQKVNSHIENFKDCYKDVELWGGRDQPVSAEKLIEFLMENPHLQEIANNIAKEMNR